MHYNCAKISALYNKKTAKIKMAVVFLILAVLCHDIVLYLPRVYMITKKYEVYERDLRGTIGASD